MLMSQRYKERKRERKGGRERKKRERYRERERERERGMTSLSRVKTTKWGVYFIIYVDGGARIWVLMLVVLLLNRGIYC